MTEIQFIHGPWDNARFQVRCQPIDLPPHLYVQRLQREDISKRHLDGFGRVLAMTPTMKDVSARPPGHRYERKVECPGFTCFAWCP